MTACVSYADIKRRYLELKQWADDYTAKLEVEIQSHTHMKRFHCFVMDQFEEAYPDEHLSRDKNYVFLSLRVAVNLKDLPPNTVQMLKAKVSRDRASLHLLSENFHDNPLVLDLDWHISEKERSRDQGEEFAKLVLADCITLVHLLEQTANPRADQGREKSSL